MRSSTNRPRRGRDALELVWRSELLDPLTWDFLVRHRSIVPLTEDAARRQDQSPSAALRACALAPECPPGVVIAGCSAAWIYHARSGALLSGLVPAGATVPHRLEMHRGPVHCLAAVESRYARSKTTGSAIVRQTRFAPGDVHRFIAPSGREVLVTSPARTALDIVCTVGGSSVMAALRALAERQVSMEDVAQRLQSLTRWRGKARGLSTLDSFNRWYGAAATPSAACAARDRPLANR